MAAGGEKKNGGLEEQVISGAFFLIACMQKWTESALYLSYV